jgi:hypothetical protein
MCPVDVSNDVIRTSLKACHHTLNIELAESSPCAEQDLWYGDIVTHGMLKIQNSKEFYLQGCNNM